MNFKLLLFSSIISSTVAVITTIYVKKAKAETYHYKNGMVTQAQDYKSAAKYCFNTLTKGVYPGEETGLQYIDLCANPIKGKIQ